MKVETYLKQGKLLDQRIEYDLKKLAELREAACSLPSVGFGREKVQTSSSGEASFVRTLIRIGEMQEKINREIDRLADLKQEIMEIIDRLDNNELRMVLIYKYLEGMTYEEIGLRLHVDRSTAVRWHRKAIDRINASGILK